jgi:hypothetical protein
MWQVIAMSEQTVTADICSKMVESATRSCQPLLSVPPEQPNPNWDAMASSFASLSSAFAWGSIILAVVAVIAALAWGKIVTSTAEKEAKAMAKACADDYIKEWLSKEAPGIIRERVDFILDATLGSGNDSDAADEIGKEA